MTGLILTIILVLLFFQFLPIILIISGILNILVGNVLGGFILIFLGWIMSNR